jgi:hypothetical protein
LTADEGAPHDAGVTGTGRSGDPPRPHTVRDRPELAARLRIIALHEETAALLNLRATRGDPAQAALLRRRADEHHRQAQLLRGQLVPQQRPARQPAGAEERTGPR